MSGGFLDTAGHQSKEPGNTGPKNNGLGPGNSLPCLKPIFLVDVDTAGILRHTGK